MTGVEIQGGHDKGIWTGPVTPRLKGRPRAVGAEGVHTHYEWDEYVLHQRDDGTVFYLWNSTNACCYSARVEGQQPVRPS